MKNKRAIRQNLLMMPLPQLFGRRRLLLVLWLLLSAGFFATTLGSYHVSREAIREAIIARELPLTSSNIYSEIQKDLVRPILISSTMANDTFVRDWVLKGEQNVDEMARYLKAMKDRYGAFSSFFVSEQTGTYYTGEGIFKQMSPVEPRDKWYYRVRAMKETYEINVDPDQANKDALTIFINYRVFDFAGNYIGVTGIGLTVDAVRHLISEYQQRYKRTIYFVDANGRIVLFGNHSGRIEANLRATEGLRNIIDHILAEKSGSYQYVSAGTNHLVNVTHVPELKWYLFVEKVEDEAIEGIRQTLYTNLAICLVVTLVVLWLTHLALRRYQRRIEEMAITDKLTGLLNRQASDMLIERVVAEVRRVSEPVAVLLIDIDHFKSINDQYGHLAGDRVLEGMAGLLRRRLRASDIAARWGGEEFLMVLKGCSTEEALRLAEELRADVERERFDLGNEKTVSVTISIGVSNYDGTEPIDHAISRADTRLYEAKRSGRNRVFASPS